MPLTIHAVSRPLAQREPVPRGEMIKTINANDEGALEEIKVLLGWVYNACTLCMSLLNPKFVAWTKTIQAIWSKDKTKNKILEMLMGRLNSTASIFPLARHLLAIIRYSYSKMNAFSWYPLRPNIRNNLKLHMRILHKARKGIYMNLLTNCEPTQIYLTDTR